jgi:transposase
VELSIRGILRGFGLKVGQVTRKTFEARIRELVTGHATLERIAEAMLSARATLKAQYEKLHKAVLAIVREDAVCRRLMTVPGVGPVVAVTFKSAVDDPSRIAKSKAVGALFGLTPKKYQSGEKDVTGGITRTGDEMVRRACTHKPRLFGSHLACRKRRVRIALSAQGRFALPPSPPAEKATARQDQAGKASTGRPVQGPPRIRFQKKPVFRVGSLGQ